MQAVWSCVGKILPYAAVKMDVHQPGDHIAPGGVQEDAVAAGLSQKGAVGADVPLNKALPQVEYLSAAYPHTGTPAAVTLLRAASSATRSPWRWRWSMEPGQP